MADPIQVILPPGIGDASWAWSKLSGLSALVRKEHPQVSPGIRVYAPSTSVNRLHPYIQMLPGAQWGGYLPIDIGESLFRSLPPNWDREVYGLWPFFQWGAVFANANIHLETGATLGEFWPFLPTDYHYPLNFRESEIEAAEALLQDSGPEKFTVYVSKQGHHWVEQGQLWGDEDWLRFLAVVGQLRRNASFVFVGAEYDRERTEAIASALALRTGRRVQAVVGQPLGVALHVLRRSCYCFSFPSGIGVLANVLRTPGLMFLPRQVRHLEQAYADPADLSSGRYRAWTNPSVEETIGWFESTGLDHAQRRGQEMGDKSG